MRKTVLKDRGRQGDWTPSNSLGRRQTQSENSRFLQSFPLENSVEYWQYSYVYEYICMQCVCVCVWTFHGARGRPEVIRDNSAWNSYGARNSSCSHQPDRKKFVIHSNCIEHPKKSCFRIGEFWALLRYYLIDLKSKSWKDQIVFK